MRLIVKTAIAAAVLLLAVSVVVESKGVKGPKKGATVELNQATGAVSLTLKNGKEAFKLSKAPKVQLGDEVPKDDPDMFRALSEDGKDIIVVRLTDDPENAGKRIMDGKGYASVGGKRYSLEQAGDIQVSGDVLTVLVDLKKTKKPKSGDMGEAAEEPDHIVVTAQMIEEDKQKTKNKKGKRSVDASDHILPPPTDAEI